jgi:HPr kinase/phosphorylase
MGFMTSVKISGVLVKVHDVGVLIRGPSGAGKSLAALTLMQRGHRLVSDDLVEVVAGEGGTPVGRSVEENVRIEIRGLGVFSAASLFPVGTVSSAPIDLVVDLDAYDPARDAGRTTPETGQFRLLQSDIPTVRVPLPSRADPALLIELLARRFKEAGTVTP